MNRYLYPTFKRPRKFSDFEIGDRIKFQGKLGTILSWAGVGLSVYIKWDVYDGPWDRDYKLTELEHE
jgi:hypothetical protein